MARGAGFRERYGPWALVVGAAEGLGAASAEDLAQRGLHLCLVDKNAERLGDTAAGLRAKWPVTVDTHVADLAEPTAAAEIVTALGEREVGLVVYVAAVSPIGPFHQQPPERLAAAVAVNCAAPVAVLRGLLPRLVDRGYGGVVLYASLAAFQGSAQISTYAATKAFNLVLAESLAEELTPAGVDVVACCPGPTETPGFVSSQPKVRPVAVMDAASVARAAHDGLGRRRVVIPGLLNRLARRVLSLLGRRGATAVVSRTTLRMYPRRA